MDGKAYRFHPAGSHLADEVQTAVVADAEARDLVASRIYGKEQATIVAEGDRARNAACN
jgi:hypothetical protein